MARSRLIKWMLVPLGLVGCFVLSLWPSPIETAPPSAEKPIAPTAAAVADLFDQECVRQRNATWIRKQNRQRMDQCTWLDDADCRYRADGLVAWIVPATDHAEIVVSVSWAPRDVAEGPPPGLLPCDINVPEKMGNNLVYSLENIRYKGKIIGKPFEQEGYSDRFDTSFFWKLNPDDEKSDVIWMRRYRDRADLLERAKDPNNWIWDNWKKDQNYYRSVKMSKEHYLSLAADPPFDQDGRNFIVEYIPH